VFGQKNCKKMFIIGNIWAGLTDFYIFLGRL